MSDMVQEGNLGLLRAVERFDWRDGVQAALGDFLEDDAAPGSDDLLRALRDLPARQQQLERAGLSALRDSEVRARLEDIDPG